MKKVTVMFVMALSAIFVNAASISWSTTSVKDITGANIGASDLYTATVTFWTDNDGAVGTVVNTSGLSVSSSKMSKYTAQTGNDFANNTSYWVQLVITSKDGKTTISSDVVKFTTDSAGTYSINFSSGAGFEEVGAKIDYASGWKTNGGDVPEPTSGLLFLVGGAMLALRRKQK